jgi:putative ABC transport system permease protein
VNVKDILRFSLKSLSSVGVRTRLLLLAVAISVSAVVMLTTVGESARSYVLGEFTQLGTHLLIVLPGRNETTGGPPPMMGETARDLTLEDALALTRSYAVKRVAPLTVGNAPVSFRRREREITILGSTAEMFEVRHLAMSTGQFLPPGDPERAEALVVLGSKVKQELFGGIRALGQWVRINDWRFRVIGVLTDKGESLGADIDDAVFIPVASAQSLFDSFGLFRILAQARSRDDIQKAKEDIREILRARHDGEEDITVITQDAVLATFDRILTALTLAVAGIAAISLAVAGVLIMNVMLVSVVQRTAEIGLLKAIGASPGQILKLFLAEAIMLSLIGAAIGLILAFGLTWIFGQVFTAVPVTIPSWSIIAAVTTALVAGLIFGIMPAWRAAKLDPVQALSRR